MTIEQLAAFMWSTRQEIHGHWPDDGPFTTQPQEIQNWVLAEAAAVHALAVAWKDPPALLFITG
jgi:hypothetical protein